MGSKRHASIVAGVLLYSVLALAFFTRLPQIERWGELLPRSVMAIVRTVVGPAVLLSGGIEAWPAVTGVAALIATFLRLAHVAWRESPGTKWFAAWLICAALVWASCGWLLVAAYV